MDRTAALGLDRWGQLYSFERRFQRDQDDLGKFTSGGRAVASRFGPAGERRLGLRTRAMRLGSDPGRWLRHAGLCRGLGSAGLSGVLLEARPLGPLADGLPVGFRLSNRPAGRWPAGDWTCFATSRRRSWSRRCRWLVS